MSKDDPGRAAAAGDPSAEPRLVAPLARLALGIFFRQVEVVGGERVPRGVPLVFVANHVNGLIDPALLMGFLPVRPRFLAKHTLWRNPVVRPFLELAAAIPVYRRQDGADPARNAETFAACHVVLAARGAIALFPEGRSHNEPGLVELKTGVSRIVLEAEAVYGGLGTRIVPVGLTFDEKGRFRSRALVHVGEPLDPSAEVALHAETPEEAVRRLTDRVRGALAEVTLNYPSWEEARLIERAAEIFERPTADLPDERTLAERFSLHQTFIEGYESLRRRCPDQVEAVARVVAAYDEQLRADRLGDVQVASSYPSAGVVRFAVKSLGLLLVRLPLAVLGTLLHAATFFLVRAVGTSAGEHPDAVATYKLFASLIFYPLTWGVIAGAAGWALGWGGAAALAVLGPLSAWVALRFHERRDHFLRQVRAFFVLRSGRRSIADLRRRRQEVLDAVWELVSEYERLASSSPPTSEVQ